MPRVGTTCPSQGRGATGDGVPLWLGRAALWSPVSAHSGDDPPVIARRSGIPIGQPNSAMRMSSGEPDLARGLGDHLRRAPHRCRGLSVGDRAEVVLASLPGLVFQAEVESIGWGVAQGSTDPATGLATIRNPSGWVREPQRFPVRLIFTGDRPQGVRYGGQANVVVFASDSTVLHAIGSAWIRLVSFLTYVS